MVFLSNHANNNLRCHVAIAPYVAIVLYVALANEKRSFSKEVLYCFSKSNVRRKQTLSHDKRVFDGIFLDKKIRCDSAKLRQP